MGGAKCKSKGKTINKNQTQPESSPNPAILSTEWLGHWWKAWSAGFMSGYAVLFALIAMKAGHVAYPAILIIGAICLSTASVFQERLNKLPSMKDAVSRIGFKPLAIIPLAFASLFAMTAWVTWNDVVHPKYEDMRLISYGMALFQTLGFGGMIAAAIAVLRFG